MNGASERKPPFRLGSKLGSASPLGVSGPVSKRNRPFLTLALCLSLTGCVGGDMDDLQAYSQQVLARKSGRIEPLPEIKLYEVYAYAPPPIEPGGEVRDPFEPFYQEEPEQIATPMGPGDGPQPDFERNREELESFPLDSLRMVGTVEKEELMWGVIRGSDGTVYRIKVGNYLGKNHGKITTILEDRIELTEIVSIGPGRWEEREASLALIE